MIDTISLIHCTSFMKHKKIVIQSSMFSLEAAQRMNMFEFPLAKSQAKNYTMPKYPVTVYTTIFVIR